MRGVSCVVTPMAFRRLLTSAAALLLAVSAFAQLTPQDKDDVLASMDEVLTEAAFVPGVDLGRWRNFLDARRDQITSTEDPRQFANIVNGALTQFGVSHIRLMPARMRRRPTWDSRLLQSGWSSRAAGASLSWRGDNDAVLRLRDFTRNYDTDQIESLMEEAKTARRLVIDLRGNGGGEVGNMMHFLGMVLPSDTPVGTFVTRRLARDYVRAGVGDGKDPVAIARWAKRQFTPRESETDPFRGKVAVLIDGGTGSASEIVANALREAKGSPLVGTPSAGAVLMSTFGRLPHGFSIQFPVSDFVSAKGKRLEGHPLVPDVEMTRSSDTEATVEAALQRLR